MKSPRLTLRWVRITIGLLAGLVLWLIWQASQVTSPEYESIKLRYMLSGILFGNSGAESTATQADYTVIPNWRGLLPLALLFGVLFATQRPLARFVTWLLAIAAAAAAALYCFAEFKLIVPWGGPMILLNCAYLCGTLIFLETEKIERERNMAIDLQKQAEAERKRIAKDLHDETLSSISRVMRLADGLEATTGLSDAPKEIRERLESCMSEMRRVINDLHPAALQEFGLATALENLVEEFARQSKIKAVFQDAAGSPHLEPFTELALYRIAQEALHNVEKHSGATEVKLKLERTDATLILKVADNGNGGAKSKPGSYGMQNIMHRAQLVGGKTVWRAPDTFESGTELVVTIPVGGV